LGARLAAAALLPLVGLGLLQVGAGPSATDADRDAAERASAPGAATVDPLVAEALARLPLIEGPAPVRFQEEGIGYDLVVVDTGSGL
ncbi:MAG TPA: hypothetical protein VMV46_20870, partial [Thermoanaerobaculia bacterium]|nr:hypothetical protein [Thermoanaerobaculia bacterium]